MAIELKEIMRMMEEAGTKLPTPFPCPSCGENDTGKLPFDKTNRGLTNKQVMQNWVTCDTCGSRYQPGQAFLMKQ